MRLICCDRSQFTSITPHQLAALLRHHSPQDALSQCSCPNEKFAREETKPTLSQGPLACPARQGRGARPRHLPRTRCCDSNLYSAPLQHSNGRPIRNEIGHYPNTNPTTARHAACLASVSRARQFLRDRHIAAQLARCLPAPRNGLRRLTGHACVDGPMRGAPRLGMIRGKAVARTWAALEGGSWTRRQVVCVYIVHDEHCAVFPPRGFISQAHS